jgi:hypothetical protein
MRGFMVLLALCAMSATSWAYCSTPSPPDTPGSYHRPTKPSVPYCVNTFNNTHTCDDWEIENYKAELRRYRSEIYDYVRKQKNYVSEAESYYSEVVSYAQCEVRSLE